MMVRQRMTLCLLFLLGFLWHTPMQAPYHIGSIRIEGIGGEEEAWIRKKRGLGRKSLYGMTRKSVRRR